MYYKRRMYENNVSFSIGLREQNRTGLDRTTVISRDRPVFIIKNAEVWSQNEQGVGTGRLVQGESRAAVIFVVCLPRHQEVLTDRKLLFHCLV